MSTWHREQGRKCASEHALKILEQTEEELSKIGDASLSVVSIRVGAEVSDCEDFEVEVEIAPGTIVAVRLTRWRTRTAKLPGC